MYMLLLPCQYEVSVDVVDLWQFAVQTESRGTDTAAAEQE